MIRFLKAAAAIAFLLPGFALASQASLNLMPMPEEIAVNPGRLSIDAGFTARLSGYRDPLLESAVDRLYDRLQQKTGIPFGAGPGDEPAAVIEIHCAGPGEPVQSPASDESYRLEVTDKGARLDAPSPIGILRGIETFLQLVDLDGESFFAPCVKIDDRPRFRWRGLHIDVSRHFQPAGLIRRNLDAMAAVKLNVFHWHLSDDQGFRVESKTFPRLHEIGSDGKYYTQAEIKAIVAYARERGIRVVPEFDIPGHSSSWLAAYPELASVPGSYRIERAWGTFEACMDPTRESTYVFLDSFIAEMAALFPDQYFHIGGDEVHPKQWNTSTRIAAFKRKNGFKDNHDLQAYFSRRINRILEKHGKKMIGWDEILHPDLPKDTVLQLWRRQPSPAELARKGYAGILSRGYYLDAMEPASFHYGIDPLGRESESLSAEERARVLGGEACMWAEFVTPENIESRIWPRTAAIAERLWSPAGLADIDDMYRRLSRMSLELESIGLRHRINYPAMIRRMAGGQDIAELKKISDLLVPTSLGMRQRSGKYTGLTPLNRMADAVLPESDTAREFDSMVRQFIADPSGATGAGGRIRELLNSWIQSQKKVSLLMQQSYLLKEVEPAFDLVVSLSVRGLEALDYIESGQKAPGQWNKETAALLERSGKPVAEMLPAIAGSIKKLADAVK